jgi:hypothetical protein
MCTDDDEARGAGQEGEQNVSAPVPQPESMSEVARELQLLRLEMRVGLTEVKAGVAEAKAGVAEARNDVQDVRRLTGTVIDELAAFRREYNEHYHPGSDD